jgi:hypothetical protein
MRGGSITAQDIVNNPAIILVIAAILLIIGAIGPWLSSGGVSQSGWSAGGGKLSIFFALVMFGSAVISLGYIRSPALESVFPVLSVSALTGLGAVVGGVIGVSARGGTAGWGLYLSIVAGIVALFAAYRAFTQKTRAGL